MFAARVSIVCSILLTAVGSQAQPTEDAGVPTAAAAPAIEAEAAPVPAEPSPEDLKRARILFQRGVQLTQREEFGAASKRFREALALHYAPSVEYNLASALYETGQYLEAYNRTQNVIQHPSTNADVKALAERLERTLRPYVARLTLVTNGDDSDIAVRLDGAPLDPKLLGVPQAVTPGKHQVVATRGETTLSDREVSIPVRTAAIIDVSVFVTQDAAAITLETSEPPPEPMPASPSHDDSRTGGDWKRDWRVWTSVGAGVIAVGLGVTLALTLGKQDGDASDKPVQGDSGPGVLKW